MTSTPAPSSSSPHLASRRRWSARLGVALWLTLVVGCTDSQHRFPPPPDTRVEPVTDVLHGVEIVDPYRWLEGQESAETRAWIAAQNEYAQRVVEPTAGLRDRFREALRPVMDVASVGRPRRAGDHEIFSLQRSGEPVAAIVRRPAPPEGEADDRPIDPAASYEIVVDPLELAADGTTSVAIRAVSPDGRLLLYAIRDGGRDEVEIRVRDLDSGEDLPDRLPTALYGGGLFFDESGEGFTYVHRDREIGPRVRYHRLGTAVSEDPELFGSGHGPERFISVSRLDDGGLLYTVQHGWRRHDLHLQRVADGPIEPILEDADALFAADPRGDSLLVRTNLDTPNYRLVEIDLEDPGHDSWRTVIPEGDDVLQGVTVIDDRLYATYLRDVATRIAVFEIDGTPAGEIEVPPLHTASISGGPEGFARLTLESFTRPSETWLVNLETGDRVLDEPSRIEVDTSGITAALEWGTSRDGTPVPVFVVHAEGLERDGSAPTLLVGYGGFNVARTPRFSAAAIAWIRQGGVYASAILRGGSEFGERWHREGMLAEKQNVFDDFIAAAEHLVESGLTTPAKLAIRGTSNGGLLVASAMTQRPELYRAVFCGFPDLDMVRFWTFEETNNKPALLEYGDASDPRQFEFLRAYSPYQAVRDGTAYPAVMLTSGDLDTRVPPLQARKMTARLQAASTSGLPVILRYDERAGHAGGRPRGKVIDDTAGELAFLWWQLTVDDQ